MAVNFRELFQKEQEAVWERAIEGQFPRLLQHIEELRKQLTSAGFETAIYIADQWKSESLPIISLQITTRLGKEPRDVTLANFRSVNPETRDNVDAEISIDILKFNQVIADSLHWPEFEQQLAHVLSVHA